MEVGKVDFNNIFATYEDATDSSDRYIRILPMRLEHWAWRWMCAFHKTPQWIPHSHSQAASPFHFSHGPEAYHTLSIRRHFAVVEWRSSTCTVVEVVHFCINILELAPSCNVWDGGFGVFTFFVV